MLKRHAKIQVVLGLPHAANPLIVLRLVASHVVVEEWHVTGVVILFVERVLPFVDVSVDDVPTVRFDGVSIGPAGLSLRHVGQVSLHVGFHLLFKVLVVLSLRALHSRAHHVSIVLDELRPGGLHVSLSHLAVLGPHASHVLGEVLLRNAEVLRLQLLDPPLQSPVLVSELDELGVDFVNCRDSGIDVLEIALAKLAVLSVALLHDVLDLGTYKVIVVVAVILEDALD